MAAYDENVFHLSIPSVYSPRVSEKRSPRDCLRIQRLFVGRSHPTAIVAEVKKAADSDGRAPSGSIAQRSGLAGEQAPFQPIAAPFPGVQRHPGDKEPALRENAACGFPIFRGSECRRPDVPRPSNRQIRIPSFSLKAATIGAIFSGSAIRSGSTSSSASSFVMRPSSTQAASCRRRLNACVRSCARYSGRTCFPPSAPMRRDWRLSSPARRRVRRTQSKKNGCRIFYSVFPKHIPGPQPRSFSRAQTPTRENGAARRALRLRVANRDGSRYRQARPL